MMLAKIFLNFFIKEKDAQNPSKITFLKFLDDFFKKIRQVSQYSIHAQPGLGYREPDDITSDLVHNLEAAALGKTVYTLNAFLAPWLSIAKLFLPYSNSPLMGILPRMLDFTDNTIGKLTNMFWNLRRITKGIIPYDGGITTEKLIEKQSEVRELMSYLLQKYVVTPFAAFKQLFVKDSSYVFEENSRRILLARLKQKNTMLRNKSLSSYFNNIRALLTGSYICPHEEKTVIKKIGEEEPENMQWYVRSKILSQILSLPAGLCGTFLNGSSIALNFLGNLFANKSLRRTSDKMTDFANGLMSLVYITGEVPANINEFFSKIKKGHPVFGDHGAISNLLVATTGMIGMVNRMKVLPLIAKLFNKVGLKTLLDKHHRILENFFLLFFSYNRYVLHTDERYDEGIESSARELDKVTRHEKFWKHFSLPFRVIFKDEEVTYFNRDKNELGYEIEDTNIENEFIPDQN